MKIEFITNNKLALDYYPPIPAKKMIPDWYKDMDLYVNGKGNFNAKTMVEENNQTPFTIKGCIPVRDYLTSGYIIRANADILITPEIFENGNAGYWWKSLGTRIESHSHSQCPIHINNKKNDYFKIINPFAIKTPKGYSCYFYQPEFFMENRFKLFPAIVDTDGYNMQPVNFPGLITAKESFTIKAGDPIMAVFPFKRDDWQSEVRMETEQENKNGQNNVLFMYIEKAYSRLFNVKKNFD